ncbi:MAG TPA: site-specific integrase [Dermatophilaceae bacterium]|nr:site-specific integrase [Dermatophilaceae bacterium]
MAWLSASTLDDSRRRTGLRMLLDWLSSWPGATWQERWESSGCEAAGRSWRAIPVSWAARHGYPPGGQEAMAASLPLLVGPDAVRPSLPWLDRTAGKSRLLIAAMSARDPNGFAEAGQACTRAGLASPDRTQVLFRTAILMAVHGGGVKQVTTQALQALVEAEQRHGHRPSGRATCYSILRDIGAFGADAPSRLAGLEHRKQLTCEQLVDQAGVKPGPVRDLLVDYLRERQPALDYTSLAALAYYLATLFWADIQAHHPEVTTLALPRQVADAWKQRLRTTRKNGPNGAPTTRVNYRECLTPVRAFYLDLAHWAVEDSRWAPFVAPCPVGAEEISRRKAHRQRKSRIDSRTRERLPALPALVAQVADHRHHTQSLLQAARQANPGTTIADGDTALQRECSNRGAPDRIWVRDLSTGQRRDLTREDDHAFWAWALVEVLRATGIRIEELGELNHHSLVEYQLPTTGEVIPLLQILPSKTDVERLLVVSPTLADVLAAIITRASDHTGRVPLVSAYDRRERLWSSAAPLLFQRRVGSENRALGTTLIHTLLTEAITRAHLTDSAGAALRFTPHDFRRMFITDAILNGLPPHIAQMIAGHRDINTTMGYKATYPEESITAYLAFLARRRQLRPTEEYRTPTDEEWEEFLGHFERRKVAVGTCTRAFGTACIHEHACVRCSMLWPEPTQRPRLIEIRDNLRVRIDEAQQNGWLGETEGLQLSLAGTTEKLSQLDHRHPQGNT